MMSRAFVFVALLMLLGCTHRQTIAYPKLTEAGPIESSFDCTALDDAILKTEAIRWVMREDGARLLSPQDRAERIATDVVASTAVSCLLLMCIPVFSIGEEGHTMLDSADKRLLSLMALKQSHGCPARNTAIVGMSDLDMYGAVAELVSEESRETPTTPVGELRAERMRLLDGLRP